MKLRMIICFIAALAGLYACDMQDEWVLEVPSFGNHSILGNTQILPPRAVYAMEGIYTVNPGSGIFGDTLVLKQTGDKISFFGKEGCYYIADAGTSDGKIYLEGYWRFARSTETGLARFTLVNTGDILQGDTTTEVFLSGVYGFDSDLPGFHAGVRLVKRFSSGLRHDPFIIGAHRGGGRTSDRLPYSENSLNMLRYTQYLGSTGVELDVRLTRDRVPVLYHDDDLNIRLVKKGPLLGYIKEYTFDQLRTFVRLIHGEQIPTLEEAMQTIISDTQLRSVWLDMKEPEALDIVIPLQQKYLSMAKERGRNLEVLIGIPSESIFNAFAAHEGYSEIPSLCELDMNKTIAINASVWAFRWTQGLLEEEVENMHARGIRSLVWTLDVPGFIEIYASQGGSDRSRRFDGILTNYPSITAYYHYVRHNF